MMAIITRPFALATHWNTVHGQHRRAWSLAFEVTCWRATLTAFSTAIDPALELIHHHFFQPPELPFRTGVPMKVSAQEPRPKTSSSCAVNARRPALVNALG